MLHSRVHNAYDMNLIFWDTWAGGGQSQGATGGRIQDAMPLTLTFQGLLSPPPALLSVSSHDLACFELQQGES